MLSHLPVSPHTSLDYQLQPHRESEDVVSYTDKGWFHARFLRMLGSSLVGCALIFCIPGIYASDMNALVAGFAGIGAAALLRAYVKSCVSITATFDRHARVVSMLKKRGIRSGSVETYSADYQRTEIAFAHLIVHSMRGRIYNRYSSLLVIDGKAEMILACSKDESDIREYLSTVSNETGLALSGADTVHSCSEWTL